MMRVALAALMLLLGAKTQDSAQISALVKKLDSPDWVEQAQAAKDLAKIGQPVLGSLRAVMLSDSPSAKYWASAIADAINRGSSGAAAPAAHAEPETPVSNIPNPSGFAPGANDMGGLVFVCNNASHGPYEASFTRCLTCAKVKRFAYDYGADCYRCAVCKKSYARKDIICDKCGQPPAGRIPIRMKTQGGL
ncbi:MAG: hypothetical protein HY293_11425 [Planctomycetes bacterium]|nr:hypothetical protein [Planctomycetota bacterium]